MAWLLLTGAGLVAETAVIVALGRRVTARYEDGAVLATPGVRGGRGSARDLRTGSSADGGGVVADRWDAVPGSGL